MDEKKKKKMLGETERKKNAIHPQSRFGRLSQRWSSCDFWWHRCGRVAARHPRPRHPRSLVPVGELIYNAHLGNTKGLLSSLRFNVFSLRDYSSFFSLVISSSLGHPCSFTFFHHVSWHAFLRFLRFSLWCCAV